MMTNEMKQISIKFRVCVERDGDEFHAYCPALKGLHVFGATVDEAVENARNAAIVYVNSLLRHNDPLPVGCDVEIKQPKGRSSVATGDHAPVARDITAQVHCAA